MDYGSVLCSRRPVIYVHGVSQIAGDLGILQWYLHFRGYHDEEVYATSYGEPGRRTKLLVEPMKCDYVKQVSYYVARLILSGSLDS